MDRPEAVAGPQPSHGSSQSGRVFSLWIGLAGVLAALAAALVLNGHRFDWGLPAAEMPAIPLAVGLAAAGLAYLMLPFLVRRSVANDTRTLLAFTIAVGCALRLILFWSTPALEDDYHRYLWDGAVSAHGFNPYEMAPEDAPDADPGDGRVRLAAAAGQVFERINHPELTTVYPPVAQAAFALAYLIRPWSLTAWRVVCLAGELATLILLLALLHAAGRSPLWAALYWWNPLIVKELINSAHMEAIVTPLVLGALWLAVRHRPVGAAAMIGLAAGAKFWPIMLAPLVLRSLLHDRRRLTLALGLLGGLCVAWALPIYLAGIDEGSGTLAYAQHWKTNSALFPALERLATLGLAGFTLEEETPGLIVRGLLAAIVGGFALRLAWRPIDNAGDLMIRAGLVTAALFLLSPAQFPWYAAWTMPFVVFRPSWGLLAATAVLPIYYVSFYFRAADAYGVFRDGIVWLIWLPVWSLLAFELYARRSGGARDA
ncbi:MAG: glycosyltransferase 87 family protein [Hyphomicrobiaceae bacterium]